MTFEEYQTVATKVAASLRNNLDRINLPLRGLQEESGKIGSLLQVTAATGRLSLAPEQRNELQDRLADVLWYVALLGRETGMSLSEIAAHSVEQIQERARHLDPDQR
jgi:NTP pyrophosphatase (non-canonical NTP hydrolase)